MGNRNGGNLLDVHNQHDNAISSNTTLVEPPPKKRDHIPSEATKSNMSDIKDASAETETTPEGDPVKIEINHQQQKSNEAGRVKGREIVREMK